MDALSRSLGRLIGPLKRRILLLVARGVVELVNDGLKVQGLQVSLLAEELRDGVERFQEYGFTSHPHPGAEAVVVFQGGDRSHGLAIAVDDRRYRLKGLAAGEVALYTDEGDRAHFKRNGEMDVVAGAKVTITAPEVEVIASTQVTVTSPLVVLSGNLEVGGVATVTGALSSATSISDPTGTMAAMRATYNAHTHPENGDGGGTTSPPNQPMEAVV